MLIGTHHSWFSHQSFYPLMKFHVLCTNRSSYSILYLLPKFTPKFTYYKVDQIGNYRKSNSYIDRIFGY